VESAGIYTIGLHDSVHSSESDHIFPLPVLKINPLIQISGAARDPEIEMLSRKE
jgi:hypothetical protein